MQCSSTLTPHTGDVYSVAWHPDQVRLACPSTCAVTRCSTPAQNHVVSGGYDKTVQLTDVRTAAVLRSFVGHVASVSRAICTRHGSLIISGCGGPRPCRARLTRAVCARSSKDSTIRFWDVVSGSCVKTIDSHLGEVTSVETSENGLQLLSGSKDNSYRLWDLRMVRGRACRCAG
jgi:WD40 repeat protein